MQNNVLDTNEEHLREQTAPARVVVFDFDGTSISGKCPVILVKYLMKKHMLKPLVSARIALWGIRYYFHLPQDEAWVRGMVFTAFEGKPKKEADAFLRAFYDANIEKLFRPEADKKIQEHKNLGAEVIVVSASFEPVVLRAKERHGFDHAIAVRMKTDSQGRYLREIDGAPIEGEEKVHAINAYCNNKYGEGNWEIEYAYADHYSDIPLLEMAKNPFAVSPGPALKREATKRNWPILDWDIPQE